MSADIFKFWKQCGPHDKVHPADRPVFSRVKKKCGFDLECLPACFVGRLRKAPIVLLYLSPGLNKKFDHREARTKAGRDRYDRRRRGYEPLPDPEAPGGKWWKSRTKHFGNWRELRSKIAILNIGAYHSKTFNDIPLLAALPSSRVSLDWAQKVLFPQAIKGERVVVCLRAARFWGLEEGKKYGKALFAPRVTRAGYMKKSSMCGSIIRKVQKTVRATKSGKPHSSRKSSGRSRAA